MTVSTTTFYVVCVGNGATTSFNFDFIADSAADIIVTYTDANGVETVLNSNQYTLYINPTPIGGLWGIGGIVTYPLVGSPIAVGTTLTIERAVPYTQDVSIQNQGAFYPQAVEQALDVLELQIQQVEGSAATVRNVRAPTVDGEINMVLPAKAAREQSFLYFDINGLPTAVAGIPSTTPIGPGSKLFFLSNYASLTLADTAASVANGVLVIDENATLGSNTTLSSKIVQFYGGIITRGSHTLTFLGSVSAGDIAISEPAGTGLVTITVGGIVNAKWLGATGNGSTDDYNAISNAVSTTRNTGQGQSTLYIPSGTYMLGTQLDLSGISVYGASSIETRLKRNATSTDLYTVKLDDSAYGGGASRQTYTNFYIDGNQSGNSHANWGLGLVGNVLNNTFTNIVIESTKTGGMRFVQRLTFIPSVNTFINLQILNNVGVGIDARCGSGNKFINLDIEGVVGQFFNISGTDASVDDLTVDGFYFEDNGDTVLDAVTIANGANHIVFSNGRCQDYGKHDGTAGSGFNISSGTRCVLDGLTITPFAGASATGHRKIIIGASSGANSLCNMNYSIIGASADIEDNTTGTVYSNDSIGQDQVYLTNTGTIANGTTIYISPSNLAGDVTTQGNARAIWIGRSTVEYMYVETVPDPGVGKQYQFTFYKNGNPQGLQATVVHSGGIASDAFSIPMTFADLWSIECISTAGAADILAGQLHLTIGIRK